MLQNRTKNNLKATFLLHCTTFNQYNFSFHFNYLLNIHILKELCILNSNNLECDILKNLIF